MEIKYKIVSIDQDTNSIFIKSAPSSSAIDIDEYPTIAYSLGAIDLTKNLEQQILELVKPNTVELETQQVIKDNALETLKSMVNTVNIGVINNQSNDDTLLESEDILTRFMNTYDKAKSGVEL